jgi:WXXGXW repeat (2 copies)
MSIRSVRSMLFALVIMAMSGAAFGQIGLMITVAPPPLPVYEQPICPDDGYIWTPGYWAYDSDISDYYWVPGTWVLAPETGYLWTPAYWGWGGDRFVFYDGYWGPLVGFYGGVNYGFGYFGVGFEGGRWDNGHFFYNQAVSNVNVTVIHNVYNNRVEERSETRVSYNGGEGGLTTRPTPQQEAAARERHVPPVAAQTQHMQEARSNPQQRASVNRGKPEIAATPKPGAYKDRGVVQSKSAGGNYNPPAARGNGSAASRPENGARPAEGAKPEENARPSGGSTNYNHVRELPPNERPSDSGSSKEQQKLYAQQQKERDKVAKQQEKEDQRAAKQNNEQSKQQVEQRHQQQTQQLQQKHQQQQQQMQQRQAPKQKSEPSKKPGE